MHLLESSFNLDASTIMYNIEQGREILLEQANVALFSGTMIDEVWNHDDPKARGNGKMPLKRSFVTWISNKFGRLLRKRIFQRIEEPSSVNVSSR
jgi:hypothetical protein